MLKLAVLSLTGSFLTLALASAATAGPAYRWTTEDGGVAFSDDLKKIPSQYRASAQRITTRSLASYPRYTPAQSGVASGDRNAALQERLERLRAFNAASTAVAEAGPASGPQTIFELDDRTSIAIPNDRRTSSEPVVVEQRRVRDRNNTTTTHLTVVRQGDEILSVVRPESAHDRADWASERDFVGDAE
jgi:hypothetical protein